MKKFFFILTLLLAMLYAPFVWAVQAIGNAPELPGYNTLVFETQQAVIIPDCRDVFQLTNMHVIYTKSTVSQKPFYEKTQTRIWAGNLLTGITGYLNHREAAVLTDKTVLQAWQSAETYIDNSKGNRLPGNIV